MVASTDHGPRRQLEGAWVPIAASVAGSRVAVDELRVRYLLLEAGGYSIIDRSNQVVAGGCSLRDAELTPATLDTLRPTPPPARPPTPPALAVPGAQLTLVCDRG